MAREYDFSGLPKVPHYFKRKSESGKPEVGRSIRSRYSEDRQIEEIMYEANRFCCLLFNYESPEGEVSFIRLEEIEPISEEEFETLRQRL